MTTILTLFGTRPEAIKLAPVIRAISQLQPDWNPVNVCSSQHTDLLEPFVRQLKIPIHHDLNVMTVGQTPANVLSRVIDGLQDILTEQAPDMVLVQGDTATALAGALAASYARIPVGHVEAGLRTGNRHSPFPEELNRRVIAQIADLHFAATPANTKALIGEGVAPDQIVLTGNTVIDSLNFILKHAQPSSALKRMLLPLQNKRILVLTTHRRENFGEVMTNHMRVVKQFVKDHEDVVLIFPVHPNPKVRETAYHELHGHDRIFLTEPFEYSDFVHLLSNAWLIASDSGGIVEEAPTLGKPVLVLRDTTERAEAVDCGVARLAGHDPQRLAALLEQAIATPDWPLAASRAVNPFGAGDAGERTVKAIAQHFATLEMKHGLRALSDSAIAAARRVQ